jgi:hypothetical protein
MVQSTKFDSFFTDRITGNLDNQGNPVLNLTSNELNKSYWMEIKQGNTSSIFFRVKTFSSTESTTIINAITQRKNVFFDKNGNITIRDPANNSMIFQWLNVLTNNSFTATNNDNIFIQKDANVSNQKLESLPRQDFIHSNDSTWILYTKDNICYVLYNPLHRRSFKKFYNTLPSTEFEDSTGDISNLFNSYCYLQRQNDLSSSALSSYADRACKCIIQEDGIDDAVGVKITEPNYRSKMRNNYFCNAPSCQVSNLEVSQDSFMYGTDGYYQRRVNKIGKCPDNNITICSLAINSAGNTNLVGTKIGQECGVKEPTAPVTQPPVTQPPVTQPPVVQPPVVQPPVTQPPVTQPPVVQPPVVQPPPVDVITDLSSISLFINTPTDFSNDYQQLTESIKANILKLDRTLNIGDIEVSVDDFSDESRTEKSYKIDIILTKQIQMLKDNIVDSIITPNLVRNFSISTVKEFETTDIPKAISKKLPSKPSQDMTMIYIIIVLLLVAFGVGFSFFPRQ